DCAEGCSVQAASDAPEAAGARVVPVTAGSRRSRPRSVASRIVLSYGVVLLAFALASTWSVATFRAAAKDAALVRQGYMPLALEARDLVAAQDTWNSQLNHITEARNPSDKRVW